MKAVVMAGGAGSRLRPITIERPKPMIPVVNKPTIEHIFNLLKQHGINEVVVTLQYLAGVIQDYFGDGKNLGMNIIYCIEEKPMGTAGSVNNVRQYLDDTFVVVSGDAITDFDLDEILAFHRRKEAKVTVTLYQVENPLEFGVIVTNREGYITRFLEKPSWGEVISDTVNTGIYIIEPEIFDYIPDNQPYDFSHQLFPKLLENNIPLAGCVVNGYWCDIGNIASLRSVTIDVLEENINSINLGKPYCDKTWIGKDVEISDNAVLSGPIYLGDSVKIRDEVVIYGPTVIGDHTIVDERTKIDRSIIWRNCYIGKDVELQGATILHHCSLKSKSVVYEGAVIADGSIVGEGAIIHPDVKIWTRKEIEPGATVKNSVIWGSQGKRTLFGRHGISGMVNVDFTPEFSTKLGAAFGATLSKGSIVVINRDDNRASRMLKRSLISGLPSVGVDVIDIGAQPLPVARYYTQVTKAKGGVDVRLSPFDQMIVVVHCIDSDGLNLSKDAQRSIERIFFREDFRRVYLDEIGSITIKKNAPQIYTEGFLQAINVPSIQYARFELVVDYASASTLLMFPNILNKLKCHVVALNSHIDESKVSISYAEFEDAMQRLEVITQSLNASLGIRFDMSGEKVFVVDDKGRRLSDTDLCAAMVELLLIANLGGTIALSVHQSHIFEEIAAKHGGKIIRIKDESHTLMKTALEGDIIMGADGDGHFIFPSFHPSVDAMIATVKLLELLSYQHRKLSEVVDGLPNYYLIRSTVHCPWGAKGTVMRELNIRFESQRVDTAEGIRIEFDKSKWVLISPSTDQPVIEITAEANSYYEVNKLVQKYQNLVESVLHEKD